MLGMLGKRHPYVVVFIFEVCKIMVSLKNIPVVNIHMGNLVEFWPALTLAIHSSTFIALDLVSSNQ